MPQPKCIKCHFLVLNGQSGKRESAPTSARQSGSNALYCAKESPCFPGYDVGTRNCGVIKAPPHFAELFKPIDCKAYEAYQPNQSIKDVEESSERRKARKEQSFQFWTQLAVGLAMGLVGAIISVLAIIY